LFANDKVASGKEKSQEIIQIEHNPFDQSKEGNNKAAIVPFVKIEAIT
jgi:hypothetical protein